MKNSSSVLQNIFEHEYSSKERAGSWHFIKHRFHESYEGAMEATRWLEILTQARVSIPPDVIIDLCQQNKHTEAVSLNLSLLQVIWSQVTSGLNVTLEYDALFDLLNPLNEAASKANIGNLAEDVLNITISLALYVLGFSLGRIKTCEFLDFELP